MRFALANSRNATIPPTNPTTLYTTVSNRYAPNDRAPTVPAAIGPARMYLMTMTMKRSESNIEDTSRPRETVRRSSSLN
jgi:hypothetical protein